MRSIVLASKSILLAIGRLPLRLHGIRYGRSVKVRGMPILQRHSSATIELADHVVLHSIVRRYHAHMHSPVKLLADRADAVIRIGEATRINGACVHAVRYIEIGKRCLIASGAQILDSNAHRLCMDQPGLRIDSVDEGKPIIIGDDVWIGINVVVLPGTRIGNGSVIGANAVVSGDISPCSIVQVAPCVITEAQV